ncbi:outer membrane protein assembly factor BamD [Nonlabens ponticola]|uniref:Outer membrane protein assembly factor BamD n=1 Tax=Nonlabens ponticola TaxID=2496866 RepID=A0A3S9MXL7_9FLAO|nr:outer membrane protein assembly factor BamD [Nonlabens ponticola]AZQ44016.1 outer membrane protein assembly factor BamD [Nonlabens ponticola]
MKKSLLLVLTAIVIASCSNYQKALKSTDNQFKIRTIDSLYNKEKYTKAINLLEQVVPQYRGTDSAAPLALKLANALYFDRRYPESGYQFETFKNSYITSPKREYATFMVGKSLYEMAPIYSKDQAPTERAMAKFQDYINTYPNGEYADEANALTQELRLKLDKKAFEIALQYYKRAPYLNLRGGFVTAITSFENFIIEHPGSEYQDDAHFYLIDSQYNYAIRSVPVLIPERLEKAKEYYNTFATRYPASEFQEDAQDLLEKINDFNN